MAPESYPLIIAHYNLPNHGTRTEHWSLVALVDRKMGHVMEIAGNSNSYTYLPRQVRRFSQSKNLRGGYLVGFIAADQIKELEDSLRQVPVVRYDPSFDCQTWILDAVRFIKTARPECITEDTRESTIRRELDDEKERWNTGEDTVEERLFPS
ncbi:hypothetical protein B0H16DRAFT_1791443 [Mycena metata]|uniref:Uncharacterized protein n=1 Tax=Mycena metata TaxID=1033252 RepID=A0AAD7JNC1_9AGAR|nr:hypothetical protein B0H16DRAFT_1791443 [Mycena metata]